MKDLAAFGLRDGVAWDGTIPAPLTTPLRAPEAPDATLFADVWNGAARDDYAEAVILSTAALALETLGEAQPEALTKDLWETRHQAKAA